MEVRAIGRRCATGAATVLGDIAQGTTPWAATSWPTLLSHLGKPEAAVRELDVGYRVPRQILDFASRLLPSIAPSLAPAQSLRADPNALMVAGVATAELADRIVEGCVAALAGLGSVVVICADADIPETAQVLEAAGLRFSFLGSDSASDSTATPSSGSAAGSPSRPRSASAPSAPSAPSSTSVPGPDYASRSGMSDMPQNADRLTLVPVTLAKGLEFDHVILVEPGRIATGEAYGLRRLYVALTRAVSRLSVFHAEPLPAELSLRTIERFAQVRPIAAEVRPRVFLVPEVGPVRWQLCHRACPLGQREVRGSSPRRQLRDQGSGGMLRRAGRAWFRQNYDL
jgi:hypothetical protein